VTKAGDILNIEVDPDTNGGLAEAAALVTGVYDDGSLRLRVFGPTSEQDTMRNYAGDDGQPYDHDQQPAPVEQPGDTPPPQL
jgi:hypothetical protein